VKINFFPFDTHPAMPGTWINLEHALTKDYAIVVDPIRNRCWLFPILFWFKPW